MRMHGRPAGHCILPRFFLFFFRTSSSELTERNSAKLCHQKWARYKMVVKNLGSP